MLGAGEARNRVKRAVERTVPFALLAHTLIVVWYARHGHDPADIDHRRATQPWYRTKQEPAFEDMLIKLRRTMIAARFSASRPAQPQTSKSEPYSQPGTPPWHNCETSVMASAAEIAAMQRAIALSAAGLGTTSPNPPVGCVLLDSQDRIVGEGYHERKGEAHAEAQALAAAGPLAVGATAVVTLEPCNHQGRTPPCRQSLIDAGVRRVVIAVIDPTSRGDGGVVELRRSGVDVEAGVLTAEAHTVLGDWLAGLQTRRPAITWRYLITGHGIEALPADTSEAWQLRLNSDAVLGADGTVREAVPGGHGRGILALKQLPTGAGAAEAARALYDGGVRRLLLDGNQQAARAFLRAGLVDRVMAFMPYGNASARPTGGLPWSLLPPGFVMTSAARTENFVRVEAKPEALP